MRLKLCANNGLLLVMLATLSACGAADAGPSAQIPWSDAGLARVDLGPSVDPQPVRLTLDPLVSHTVCRSDIALRGQTAPGATVTVRAAAGGDAIGETQTSGGNFCIEVALRQGVANSLVLQAKHPVLGVSEPVGVEVLHDPDCGAGAGGPAGAASQLVNVALGAPVKSRDEPRDYLAKNVTDGDRSTWTRWVGKDDWNPFAAYDGWVMISLEAPAVVEEVVVIWRDEIGQSKQDYGKEYLLLYTPFDLGDPDRSTWTIPSDGMITNGDGGEDVIRIGGQPIKHVAVWLQQNGEDNWDEAFAISEIELRVRAQPELPAATCASAPETSF